MVYKFDDARHKPVATTTGPDGKVREKIPIPYELDDARRFSSGLIFGPDGQLRFKGLDMSMMAQPAPRGNATWEK